MTIQSIAGATEEEDGKTRCGRPTTSGRPCRVTLSGGERACRRHATDDDAAYREGWHAGWSAGFGVRERICKEYHPSAKPAENEPAPKVRYHTEKGEQIVSVGKYSYAWPGAEPLQVGDRVLLPGNWAVPGQRVGTVTGLGTDYAGTLQSVIARAVR